MTKYSIKLHSKNKESLKHFLQFWKKPHANITNLQQILNVSERKKKRKIIAILKSPHVNKKAQEHFQQITYTKKVLCFSWEIRKSIVLLKKVRNHLFPGIKMQIEKKFAYKKNSVMKNALWNPCKIPLKTKFFSFNQQKKKPQLTSTKCNKNTKLVKKTFTYIKNLDTYGMKKATLVWIAQLVRAKD
jgi:ribosomal protein S10